MSSSKTFRLNKKLLDAIDRDMAQHDLKDLTAYVSKALEHFLICKDGMKFSDMRLIVLRYPAECKRCQKHIDAGDWALYGRGFGAICMDCYVERIGDRALVAKFLKMREYKRIVKALKAEAERLAIKVETGQVVEHIEKINERTAVIHSKLMEFFRALGNIDEKEKLDDLHRLVEEQKKTLETVKNFIERKVKVKSKSRSLHI